MTDPILSRFDILCVVKDEVDESEDLNLVIFFKLGIIRYEQSHQKPSYVLRKVRVQGTYKKYFDSRKRY